MPYVNFLCLLGWSPKDNREQALLRFTPSKEKASINSWRDIELVRYVKIALQQAGLCPPDDERKFQSIVDVIRSRFSTLHDFATRGRAYFADDFPIQPEAVDKLNVPGARELLRELGDRLAAAGEFTEQSIEAELGKLAAERGVKAGVIINASRAILTRQAVGRERATRRLKSA